MNRQEIIEKEIFDYLKHSTIADMLHGGGLEDLAKSLAQKIDNRLKEEQREDVAQ